MRGFTLFIFIFKSFIKKIFGRPCHVACGILVPGPGIKLVPSAVKALSLNCWTAREFPHEGF